MGSEQALRIALRVLLGTVIVMRGCFSFRVRQSGERLMPDREAVEKGGLDLHSLMLLRHG